MARGLPCSLLRRVVSDPVAGFLPKTSFVVIRYVEREDGSAVSFCAYISFSTYEEARLYVDSEPRVWSREGQIRYLIEEVCHARVVADKGE